MFRGTRIRLRPVEQHDLELLVGWRNTPENWVHFFNKFPLSVAGQQGWFSRLVASETKKLFIICTLDDDQPIGTIGLDNIDFPNQSSEYGNILVGDKQFAGKGLAREATQLLLSFAFQHLNMNRVYLRVLQENTSAIRLYERTGFRHEGVQRQAYFSNGCFRNVVLMALLRHEHCCKEP